MANTYKIKNSGLFGLGKTWSYEGGTSEYPKTFQPIKLEYENKDFEIADIELLQAFAIELAGDVDAIEKFGNFIENLQKEGNMLDKLNPNSHNYEKMKAFFRNAKDIALEAHKKKLDPEKFDVKKEIAQQDINLTAITNPVLAEVLTDDIRLTIDSALDVDSGFNPDKRLALFTECFGTTESIEESDSRLALLYSLGSTKFETFELEILDKYRQNSISRVNGIDTSLPNDQFLLILDKISSENKKLMIDILAYNKEMLDTIKEIELKLAQTEIDNVVALISATSSKLKATNLEITGEEQKLKEIEEIIEKADEEFKEFAAQYQSAKQLMTAKQKEEREAHKIAMSEKQRLLKEEGKALVAIERDLKAAEDHLGKAKGKVNAANETLNKRVMRSETLRVKTASYGETSEEGLQPGQPE